MTATIADPIGALYLDAQKRALKKAGRTHTSEAPCGCQVTVAYFGEVSHTFAPDRCSEHPKEVRRGKH